MAATRGGSRREERIDITWDYEVCAWARHFNTSQQRIKDAVRAVGDRADHVREQLAASAGKRPGGTERPSAASAATAPWR